MSSGTRTRAHGRITGRTDRRASARARRHLRVRKKVSGSAVRPRLVVTRSARHTFAQIIEGNAEMVIDKISHFLKSGEGIIIPANSPNFIRPNGRFKMIQTIIKSGYE